MADYTPTTAEVRADFVMLNTETGVDPGPAFDRWLATIDPQNLAGLLAAESARVGELQAKLERVGEWLDGPDRYVLSRLPELLVDEPDAANPPHTTGCTGSPVGIHVWVGDGRWACLLCPDEVASATSGPREDTP